MTNNNNNKKGDVGRYLSTPKYILEEDDFLTLEREARRMSTKTQTGQTTMGIELLKSTLWRLYGTTSIKTFEKKSTLVGEVDRFSSALCKIFEEDYGQFSLSYLKNSTGAIRRILLLTSVPETFSGRITTNHNKPVYGSYSIHHILPTGVRNLDESHRSKRLLSGWIDRIRENTRNGSPNSLKNILSFITNSCVRKMNLSIDSWNPNDVMFSREIMDSICDGKIHKFSWLRIFIVVILDAEDEYGCILSKFKKTICSGGGPREEGYPDRLSITDLERLYSEFRSSTRDELIFMLLITTGMRVHAMVSIRIDCVASISGENVLVFERGRTIEKGNRWFSFGINSRVRELIRDWLLHHRKGVDSEYLFPGVGGCVAHLTTATIRGLVFQMGKRAGIAKRVHPHSFRHSYAYILLNCGNSVDIVSKLMGHSSSSTTEQYYLRENQQEISERAEIPWMIQVDKKTRKIVPDFLKT